MQSSIIPRTDLSVSRIAYGTAGNGVSPAAKRSGEFLRETVRALHTAHECGITLFDLADVYGAGQSELALSEWLKQTPGVRHRIVIQSKCGLRLPEQWVPGDPVSAETCHADLSCDHIIGAVEGSLQRLGCDHLDVLLLHAPDYLVEPEEVAHAFDLLQASGKVRYFGVSNHNLAQIELLSRTVRQPLVVNQIRLGLAYYLPLAVPLTEVQYSGSSRLVDWCRLQQMQVQAFSPLREDNIYSKPGLLCASDDASPPVNRVAQMLADIAKRHRVTSAAIMLAWLLRHPACIVPVIGSVRPEHVKENCRAEQVTLSRSEWYALLQESWAIQARNVSA
jgi:predicted oxidoreductase